MLYPPDSRKDLISQMIGEYTGEILVLPGRCDGCNDCIEACKKAVAPQAEEEPVSRITVKELNGAYIPIFCHNCEEAPCVAACMPGARTRSGNGWVQTDYKRCVGCWMCIMACPFGAIERADKEHVAYKCDGCLGNKTPACITSCKPGALVQTGPDRFTQDRRRERARGYFLPPES